MNGDRALRKHFLQSDLPLRCRYVEAVVLAETAAFELHRGAVLEHVRPVVS